MDVAANSGYHVQRPKPALGALVRGVDRFLVYLGERQKDGFSHTVLVLSLVGFVGSGIAYVIFSNGGNFEPNYICTTIILLMSLLQVMFATFIGVKSLLRAVFSFVLMVSFLASCVSWFIYTIPHFWPALKFFPFAAATLCVLVSVGMTYVIVSGSLESKLLELRSEIHGNLFATLMFFMALFFNITLLLSFALAFDDQPLHRALSSGLREELAELQQFDVSLYSMSVFDPAEAKKVLLGTPAPAREQDGIAAATSPPLAEELGWRFIFDAGTVNLASGKEQMCRELSDVKTGRLGDYWNFCEFDRLRQAVAACRRKNDSSIVTIWAPGIQGAAARAVLLQARFRDEFSRSCDAWSCNPNQIQIQGSSSADVLDPSRRWQRSFPPEIAQNFKTVLDVTHQCSEATAVENYALRLSRGRRLQLLDYIYFTTYTITTTGYGDIVPISGFAKFICSIANFFELFFVVVFFNCLVAVVGEKRQEAAGSLPA